MKNNEKAAENIASVNSSGMALLRFA